MKRAVLSAQRSARGGEGGGRREEGGEGPRRGKCGWRKVGCINRSYVSTLQTVMANRSRSLARSTCPAKVGSSTTPEKATLGIYYAILLQGNCVFISGETEPPQRACPFHLASLQPARTPSDRSTSIYLIGRHVVPTKLSRDIDERFSSSIRL